MILGFVYVMNVLVLCCYVCCKALVAMNYLLVAKRASVLAFRCAR